MTISLLFLLTYLVYISIYCNNCFPSSPPHSSTTLSFEYIHLSFFLFLLLIVILLLLLTLFLPFLFTYLVFISIYCNNCFPSSPPHSFFINFCIFCSSTYWFSSYPICSFSTLFLLKSDFVFLSFYSSKASSTISSKLSFLNNFICFSFFRFLLLIVFLLLIWTLSLIFLFSHLYFFTIL